MSTHNICFNGEIRKLSSATDKRGYPHNIFLIDKNICCGYSLEVPHWGTSNEYPQHMFSLRNKKDISSFRMKKVPYLLLWIISTFRLKKVLYLDLWNRFWQTVSWKQSPLDSVDWSGLIWTRESYMSCHFIWNLWNGSSVSSLAHYITVHKQSLLS